MSKTIYALFCETVARQPERPAIGAVQSGVVQWLTWQQLAERVEQERERLRSVGVVAGSCVAACDANSFDWPVRNLAVWAEGAVLVPCDMALPLAGPLPADVVTIVQTSGTGAEPQRVLLSAENLATNAVAMSEISKQLDENGGEDNTELRLSFLPFGHLYARTCDLYTWIVRGTQLVLVESRETLFDDCRLVRPTVINGVPYFFQKAIDLADLQGVSLRDLLGGSIRRCYSGGAALAPAVEARFFAEEIPLYNGYGLTETSPVATISTPEAFKQGTVGRPLPGVEVRIDGVGKGRENCEGEILVRGPNVMLGYANERGGVGRGGNGCSDS